MSNAIDDGGTVHPIMSDQQHSGMTLLDYFAAKAMQSLIERYDDNTQNLDDLATASWGMAFKMLEEIGRAHV